MYFTVCLDDFAWCHGTMERTAGVVPATGDKRPYLIDEDGQIWRHESGYEAGDDALEFHLASAPIEIEDGLYYYDVNGWFVDWKETTGVIYLTLDSYERVYSDDAPVLESQSGYYDSADPEGVIDFSINGRAIAVTIQSDEAGTFFRMGVPKLDVVRRGSRR